MFSILSTPPDADEITRLYNKALQKQKANDDSTIGESMILYAPPIVDLCLLPIAIPMSIAESVITAPFKAIDEWLNDSNPEIYQYASKKESNAYDPENYGPCKTYVENVRAQGRNLTVGEIASLQRYKWTVDQSSQAIKAVTSVAKDALGSFFRNT